MIKTTGSTSSSTKDTSCMWLCGVSLKRSSGLDHVVRIYWDKQVKYSCIYVFNANEFWNIHRITKDFEQNTNADE